MAVSDTLAQAIEEIDDYLAPPSLYRGAARLKIVELRERMERVRIYLDTPPGTEGETLAENEA